jgi:hypothetical protein
VGSLVNLLGIKRRANAHSHTGAEENVVSDGSNTTVVDLGLFLGISNAAYADWHQLP